MSKPPMYVKSTNRATLTDKDGTPISAGNPLPVSIGAGSGLTDEQLRNAPVPVSVANLPETQPISAETLPLPTSASTEAKQDSIIQLLTNASIQLTIRVDEVSETITYVGRAVVGTLNTAASWQICRITVSGTVTTSEYADSNTNFDNVWDDRATLTYG